MMSGRKRCGKDTWAPREVVIDEGSTGESNKSRKRENSKSEHKRLKLDTEEGVSWGEAEVVAEEEKSGFLYNNQ